jgi:hypothetical protein
MQNGAGNLKTHAGMRQSVAGSLRIHAGRVIVTQEGGEMI